MNCQHCNVDFEFQKSGHCVTLLEMRVLRVWVAMPASIVTSVSDEALLPVQRDA